MVLRFFLILSFLSGSFWSVAQLPKPEIITIEQGLSQGMVYDLLQTRDGFLWISTKDGLNRYDGNNFKILINNPFDSFSLTENTVTALFEDSRGWLWIGTESKGLELYDRKKDRFYHFPLVFKQNLTNFSSDILKILESPDGRIWALQRGVGLVCIEIPEKWKENLPDEADLTHIAKVSRVPMPSLQRFNGIPEAEDGLGIRKDGKLVLCTNFRILVINPQNNEIEDVTPSAGFDRIWAFAIGKGPTEGDIYGITSTKVFRIRNGETTFLKIATNKKIDQSTARIDKTGGVWLTIEKKIWYLKAGQEFKLLEPDWILDEMPTALTTDRNGNVWVGTFGYGLRKFNLRKKSFHSTAQGETIWGIWKDNKSNVYCKVFNKLKQYDAVTGKLNFDHGFENASSRVLDMVIQHDGYIWILGREEVEDGNAYFQCFSPDKKRKQLFTFPFNMYTYARLMQARNGTFWMTGGNCQLVSFNPSTHQPSYYSYEHLFPDKANSVRAYAILEDNSGNLWIGTQQGLIKGVIQHGEIVFQLINSEPSKKSGLSSNTVACLLLDPEKPNDFLWIGTKGGGINRMDLNTGSIQYITTEEGLPNNVIYGLLPGNKDEIWCSTNRGLAKIDLKANGLKDIGITTFTAANGLQDNEFNTQAYFKAADGELFFGGIKGFNRFISNEIESDSAAPKVYLVGIEINHKPVYFSQMGSPLEAPLERLSYLELEYEQNNLSFEFAALDFTDPAHNLYRYKIEGLDPKWVESGNDRSVHFTHLAPGTYTLFVEASNGEGGWLGLEQPIKIIIHPPWWQSKLAYMVYVLLGLWVLWETYKFQIRRIKIKQQLAFDQREIERVRALEQMKTDFFANVTHEFRTPLTLIQEPIRQLMQHPNDPQLREKLRLIERNSHRLLGLVNQLLDMAKLESGHMQLDLRMGNLGETVRSVFQSFLVLGAQKNIQLHLEIEPSMPYMVFDAPKMELILNNLLSNALKFTPEKGKISLICRFEAATDQKMVYIQVIDNGPGIAEKDIPLVFDRFYQVDAAGGGTGIGLALSQELAVLMGGQISVQSSLGQGAVFTFRLPVNFSEHNTAIPDVEPLQQVYTSSEKQNQEEHELPIVLIIEDNIELRHFIGQSIGSNWQIIEASNGDEGIQKAQELIPDLVVSDLMMPGKDGYAVCRALKNGEMTAHIPIILLTARSGMESKLMGLRQGADDYLTKPFNAEELKARMENLIASRRQLLDMRQNRQKDRTTSDLLSENHLMDADKVFLRRLQLVLEECLSDSQMGVEEFARKMFISRVQLHRKMKAIANKNAGDYIRDFRLERAMAMLKNREGLVVEIADRVGFVNEKYFSTVFKEKYGISPSQVG